MTGTEIAALDDEALRAHVLDTTIFARVSPEQKARLIRAHRAADRDVAFLGDGVNDAVALHAADVGISVESATDVAKDAADIVLLEKDLGVLADGVSEGRRTFANTIKYVLMGTSSNFGNMFSAAVASTFLSFLPMLPSQILLNNLLYDTSQMAIPTDLVDPELVARPSHWDITFIRRFMLTFGPISSIFDFATFAIMLGPFGAGPALFRSGWFVESLATQTLVVFVIRTHRVPFWRSRPEPSAPRRRVRRRHHRCAACPTRRSRTTSASRALPADFFAGARRHGRPVPAPRRDDEAALLRTRPRARPSGAPARVAARPPHPVAAVAAGNGTGPVFAHRLLRRYGRRLPETRAGSQSIGSTRTAVTL